MGYPDSNSLTPNGVDAVTTRANDETRDLYQKIGQLTRSLHDALMALGLHDSLSGSRDDLPDARDRLAYIARLTGEAAERVLNAVDQAQGIQDSVGQGASALQRRWEAVLHFADNDAARSTPAGKALVQDTIAFLTTTGQQSDEAKTILTDIMMAQDFHDLTGQVIRKVIDLCGNLEDQLVRLLIDASPEEMRPATERVAKTANPVPLEGPVVNAEGRTDIVQDQAGVDDLLASLGF